MGNGQREVGQLEGLDWAKRPKRLPVFFTRGVVDRVPEKHEGMYALMGRLMYGSGMRLSECCALRVQDVDFGMHWLLVQSVSAAKVPCTSLSP